MALDPVTGSGVFEPDQITKLVMLLKIYHNDTESVVVPGRKS